MQKSFLVSFAILPLTTLLVGVGVPVSAQMCDPTIMSCADEGMSSTNSFNDGASTSTEEQNQFPSSDSSNWNGEGGASGWNGNGGFEGSGGNSQGSQAGNSSESCQWAVNVGCQLLGRWAGSRIGGFPGAAIRAGTSLGCQSLADLVCKSEEQEGSQF